MFGVGKKQDFLEKRFLKSSKFITFTYQAAATPGEYASAKSRWFDNCLVGVTETLPGRPFL